MRILLTMLLLLTSLAAFPQSLQLDSLTREVKYEHVFEVPLAKDEAYNRAKVWVAKKLPYTHFAIEAEDKDNGQLFLVVKNTSLQEFEEKGLKSKMPVGVEFNCRLYFKDNRYKVVVDKIVVRGTAIGDTEVDWTTFKIAEQDQPKSYARSLIVTSESAIKDMTESLSAHLHTKSETDF